MEMNFAVFELEVVARRLGYNPVHRFEATQAAPPGGGQMENLNTAHTEPDGLTWLPPVSVFTFLSSYLQLQAKSLEC